MKRSKIYASDLISPAVASVLDRTSISDTRKAAYLISATVRTFGTQDQETSAVPCQPAVFEERVGSFVLKVLQR